MTRYPVAYHDGKEKKELTSLYLFFLFGFSFRMGGLWFEELTSSTENNNIHNVIRFIIISHNNYLVM